GVLDHQVHIQRDPGPPVDRLHHQRADGDVGHEVPVHHVHVEQVCLGLHLGHFLGQGAKVRGQHRWGDLHHGTSSGTCSHAPCCTLSLAGFARPAHSPIGLCTS